MIKKIVIGLIALVALTALFSVALLFARQTFSRGPFAKVSQKLTHLLPQSNEPSLKQSIFTDLDRVLDSMEVFDSSVTRTDSDTLVRMRVQLPRGRPQEWYLWRFSHLASQWGYRVEDCHIADRTQTMTLRLGGPSRTKKALLIETRPSDRFHSRTARVAILIDKFNYDTDKTTLDFLAYPQPLTFSMLATDTKSNWVAQALDQKNKEVVVALPMESHFAVAGSPTEGVIMVHYSEQTIRKIVDDAMKAIPNFSGFISLNGSRVLEDERVMKIVLGLVRRHNGYFIDGGAARNSVASAIALELQVPFEGVQGFIGSKNSPSEIDARINALIVEAQKRGKLVIRAEASAALIKILNIKLPVFKTNGIDLVFLSQMVRQYH